MVSKYNSLKKFFEAIKDLSTIGIANIIGTLIYGIFWFFLASLLGTEQYGRISYLITIGMMASAISSFGASNTVTMYTAKEQKIQTSVYFLVVILSIIVSLIIFFIVYDVGVSLLVFGAAGFSLVLSESLGRKLYKNYSKYVIGQRIILVGVATGLYFLMGTHGIILGFALSYLPYLIILYHGSKNSKIDLISLKTRIGFMTNSYAMDLSTILVVSADKLIVYPMFGYALLGNYQLGIQFLAVLTVLPNSVYQYILPRQASGISDKKLVKATILFSIGLAILGWFFAPKVVPLLFPGFKEAGEITQIMSLAIIPTSINLIYASKFYASEKSRIVLTGSLLYLGIQTLMILILGKFLGINGAAVAPVLGSTCASIYYIAMNKLVIKKQIR